MKLTFAIRAQFWETVTFHTSAFSVVTGPYHYNETLELTEKGERFVGDSSPLLVALSNEPG